MKCSRAASVLRFSDQRSTNKVISKQCVREAKNPGASRSYFVGPLLWRISVASQRLSYVRAAVFWGVRN